MITELRRTSDEAESLAVVTLDDLAMTVRRQQGEPRARRARVTWSAPEAR